MLYDQLDALNSFPNIIFIIFLFLSSGMFFDGNHTYMIEPGGEDNKSVSSSFLP